MKKLLALVLALVMTLSLATVSTNAFTDNKAINEDYAEAVQVLNGMKVFKGYEDGSFKPLNDITRAEVAAIVYRIYTADVTDAQAKVYAGYGNFDDVNTAAWYAGYVGYCTNAGFIKGYGDGKFGPNDKVTGYQALAMILRAVGYGKNGEFEGKDWELHVAQVAQQIGALVNVGNTESLKAPASRQLVAELLFQSIKAAQVVYTPALGYQVSTAVLNRGKDEIVNDGVHTTSLGYKNFGLFCEDTDRDDWGRPSYSWIDCRDKTGNTVYATFNATPLKAYTTPVAECDMAADLGLKKDTKVALLTVNGNEVKAKDMADFFNGDDAITVLATKKTVGEQGRLTEVYKVNGKYEVVMIDTFLAVVTDVTEVEYDRNKHISARAELSLTVFDKENTDAETFAGTDAVLASNTNWEYEEGDWLLLYAKTTDAASEEVETNKNDALTVYEILGKPETMKGAQTAYSNKAVHIVEKKTYDDAHQFNLDQAENQTTNYIWFFDTYGNLIGAVEAGIDKTYGVITEIYWKGSFEGENGKAVAKITYIDGTTKTETVYSIRDLGDKITDATVLEGTSKKSDVSYKDGVVSTTKQYNVAEYTNNALYKITEGSKGLNLEKTTELTAGKAWTVKGEATIEEGKAVATKTTQYLVWTGSTYETYTGFKNVPSYAKAEKEGCYWAANLSDKDTVAEYVFINAKEAAKKSTVTFFADTQDTVTITTTLDAGAPYYYTISGGYVNGELGDLIVAAGDDEKTFQDSKILAELVDLENVKSISKHKAVVYGLGELKVVDLEDEAVLSPDSVTTVGTQPVEVGTGSGVYALQLEDKFDSASVSVTAVNLDDGTYTVDDDAKVVNCATSKKTIESIVKDYQKSEENAEKYGNVYIVYTEGKRDKFVSEIYIASPVEEETEPQPPVPEKVYKVTFESEETSILDTDGVRINGVEKNAPGGEYIFKVMAGDKSYTFELPEGVTAKVVSEADNLWKVSGLKEGANTVKVIITK